MTVLSTLNAAHESKIISLERGCKGYGVSPVWKQDFFLYTAAQLKRGRVLLDDDITDILCEVRGADPNLQERAQKILRTTMAASILLTQAVELTVMSLAERAVTYHDSLVHPTNLNISSAAARFFDADELTQGNSLDWKQLQIEQWRQEADTDYQLARVLRPA